MIKAAEGTSEAFAFLTLLLVVNLSPGAIEWAQVGPQVHGGPKMFVAGAAQLDLKCTWLD